MSDTPSGHDSSNQTAVTQIGVLGWREWLILPDLGLPAIKAKVDTGAKTSALHAFEVQSFKQAGKDYVRFAIHPLQYNHGLAIECEAPLLDQREVTDSGGHRESRFVIETTVQIAQDRWPIELTLSNRDNMRFRMLLGRQAMWQRFQVDPASSYLCGVPDLLDVYPSD